MPSVRRLRWTAIVCVAAGLAGALIVLITGLAIAYPMLLLGFAAGAIAGVLIRSGDLRRGLESGRDGLAMLASEFELGQRTSKL